MYCLIQYFVGHKNTPCFSTSSLSVATMVVSGFCPYHRLVHDGTPTEHAGVILTPWVMDATCAWFGCNPSGGDWHLVPSPPCFFRFLRWARQCTVHHDNIWINATKPPLIPYNSSLIPSRVPGQANIRNWQQGDIDGSWNCENLMTSISFI